MTKLLAIAFIVRPAGIVILFSLFVLVYFAIGLCWVVDKILRAGRLLGIMFLTLALSCLFCRGQDYTSPMPDISAGMAPPQKAFSLINPNHVYVPRTNWTERFSWTASASTNVYGYQVGYFTNWSFSLIWYLGTTTNLYWNFQATNLPGVLVFPAVRTINTNGYVSSWLI